MKYINPNTLCLEASEFIRTDKNPEGLIPKGTYDTLKAKGNIVVHGRGGNGNGVLIEFETLPHVYKSLVIERFGDPYKYVAKQPLRDLIKSDISAIRFFDTYILPSGYKLDAEKRRLYSNDAAILNAFKLMLQDKKALKKTLNIGLTEFWQVACELVKDAEVKRIYPNTLPSSDRRLKPIYNSYISEGYKSLVDLRGYTENNRKVDGDIEQLILAIYAIKNKPYAKEVAIYYNQFMEGKLHLVDESTGEMFEPKNFYKDGKPIVLSETTIWRYLNKPGNDIIVDKLRLNSLDFSNKHIPFNKRHAPVYSLSKITMDDRQPAFKMHNGDRIWSYLIADVQSKCIIGKAFGRNKDRGLFLAAVKDMFCDLTNKNIGYPAEIEIEHHISNTFADDLLKAGNVFPYVRFCRPANPREKRAEHTFRHFRYELEKNIKGFQGRPFARDESNRFNERDKTTYSYEEIVATEESLIASWNNMLHDDQDKFPGMSRLEVFLNNINPELIQPDLSLIAPFIGNKTQTSIRSNKYCQVKHNLYELPDITAITRFKDSRECDAWYIPTAEGEINEVHLYQGEQYICTCAKTVTYNEAQFERTDTDITAMHKQFAYRTSFDTTVKQSASALPKIKVIDSSVVDNAIKKGVSKPVKDKKETVEMPVSKPVIDWKAKAKNDL